MYVVLVKQLIENSILYTYIHSQGNLKHQYRQQHATNKQTN